MVSAPLRFVLAPSNILAGMVVAAHVVATASVLAAELTLLVKLAGGLIILLSVVSLRWPEYPRFYVADGSGDLFSGGEESPDVLMLSPGSQIWPCWVVLRYRQANKHMSQVVMADALPSGQLRSLKVWLRWRANL